MGSLAECSLDALVERTLLALREEPMIFLLGAGGSRAAPSCLPQPPLIQEAAFEHVCPRGAERDLSLIKGAVPEVYHEVLLDLGGSTTRDIWKVLSEWESPGSRLAHFDLGPNVVHLLVVYLSWKARSPIVTVNFDQMLERAATRLDLRPITGIGERAEGDSVAIWKLHGSVEEIDSVRTTLQGITATDPDALGALEREFSRATGCLIGYSGQDIDFFPFLCAWESARRPVYWLSLNLSETAITRFPDPFLGVDEYAEEWARRVIERLPSDNRRARLLKAELVRPLPASETVDGVYGAVVKDAARRIYGTSPLADDSRRLLAHAVVLAALGRNRDADAWLDRYMEHSGDAGLDCRAHLLRSALAHEFARYEDSKEHAQLARELALKGQMDDLAAEAILRIDEANRMLYVPPRLPVATKRAVFGPRSLATIARMFFHAWTLRKLRNAGTASPRRLRASFEYLEHLVRVAAILQGIAEQLLPGRAAEGLFAAWWRYVESRSYAVGYTLGIGNAKKYRLRRVPLEERKPSEISVLDLYRLIPSPTGASIHHRDVAAVALAQMRRLSGSERERKREKAIELFDDAIAYARAAGDPSLELKALFGLRGAEPGRTWSASKIQGLVDRIQSPAYAKLADRILAELSTR
jgi:hypothetical protein